LKPLGWPVYANIAQEYVAFILRAEDQEDVNVSSEI
jgi:hypothetical protein